jgi:hypothetical protein
MIPVIEKYLAPCQFCKLKSIAKQATDKTKPKKTVPINRKIEICLYVVSLKAFVILILFVLNMVKKTYTNESNIKEITNKNSPPGIFSFWSKKEIMLINPRIFSVLSLAI